jgi:hypothetical protein
MKNSPIVVTAASVVALMSAHANAGLTGNAMNYTQSIDIVSTTGSLFDGSGVGSGSGSFDTNGQLTVASEVQTSLPALGAPGVVTASTVYTGSIVGNTWTYSGTSQSTFVGCTGNGALCSNVTVGTGAPSTGNAAFTLSILTGGAWVTSSTIATLATLNVDHGLAAAPPVTFDANKVPTMPVYIIGITALALFGAAARRLRASDKTTQA